jgi:hypothetical protein
MCGQQPLYVGAGKGWFNILESVFAMLNVWRDLPSAAIKFLLALFVNLWF